MRQPLKGQGMADESLKTEDMYGKAAQPSGLCGQVRLGQAYSLAHGPDRNFRRPCVKKQHGYGNTRAPALWSFCNEFWRKSILRNRKHWKHCSPCRAR